MTPAERPWSADSLPLVFGGPVASGRLRHVATDFEVEELASPAIEPDGAHALLYIEKRDLTTWQVANRLAAMAGVAPHAVGYAGLKDRRAVTRQWFSVQLRSDSSPDWMALPDGIRCLEVSRAARKLRPGELNGNRFRIRVRGAGPSSAAVGRLLSRITTVGLPNYFGPQRFGRDGANLSRARRLLVDGDAKATAGTRRGLLISAARAHLFNLILAGRVAADCWNRPVSGDILQLDGDPRRIGPVTDPGAYRQRVQAQELHPTGALWGRADGTAGVVGDAAGFEHDMLAAEQPLCRGLERIGVAGDRRPLRARVGRPSCERVDDDLLLGFELPPGSYATVLLRELVAG